MMAAWRGLAGFQGHASVRAWLYRIATSRNPRGGAARPMPEHRARPAGSGQPLWLEPYPDHVLDEYPARPPGPQARYNPAEGISLAFVAAIQYLPPLQRAALVLRDVLGFPAVETAGILDCTVASVESLLQLARANLPPNGLQRPPLPGSAPESAIAGRFSAAFERGDIEEIVALLTDDAMLTMPPLPFVYRGRTRIGDFLAAIFRTRRFRLVPTRANGQPAFGCYVRDPAASLARSQGLIVLTLSGEQIAQITRFLDNGVLGRFGLPRILPEYNTDTAPSEGQQP